MTTRIETKQDVSTPIIVSTSQRKEDCVQESIDSYNRYIMTERESHGKRTLIRVNFEIYARKSGKRLGFERLRNRSVLLSVPSAKQADLAMRTLEKIAQALDGKLLAEV